MAIPSSGTIKMGGAGTNSIAQVKAGTDTGTPTAVTNVSLKGLSVDGVTDFNDGTNRDIAVSGSTPNQTSPFAMSEFHGYSQISLTGWPTVAGGLGNLPFNQWGQQNYTSSSLAQVYCSYAFGHDTTNNRLTHYVSSGNSGAMQTFVYGYQTYTGLDNATFQVKAVYSTSNFGVAQTMNNPDSGTPASGVWTNITADTSLTYGHKRYQWLCTDSSGTSGGVRIQGSVQFFMRALIDGVYYPNATGYSSPAGTNVSDIFLRALYGTQQQAEGP